MPRRPLLLLLLPLLIAADAREVGARKGANLQRPVWSPGAEKLSYEANFHDKKVIELHVSTDQAWDAFRRVTPSVRGASGLTAGFSTGPAAGQVAMEVSWAPPSIGRFVYSASNERLDYDLYISGGGAVAAAPGTDGGAIWSPDGAHIAFTSSRTGEGDLYLIDVQHIEQPPRQLTHAQGSSELFATWAPNSTALAYVAHTRTGDNIWMLPSLDATPVQVTTWGGNQIRPTFSPTNATLAFYANHDNHERFDLYVVDARAGATPTQLAQGVVMNARGPTWSPDGSRIVFVLDDDTRFDPIAQVNVDASAKPSLIELGTVGHGDLDLSAASDGSLWLAVVAQGKRTDADRSFDRLFVSEISLP